MVRELDYPSTDDVIIIDWHHAGYFDNPDASARAAQLGASSAPDTYFDAIDNQVGAGDSIGTYNSYMPTINSHVANGSKFIFRDALYDFDLDAGTVDLTFTIEIAPGETTVASARFLQSFAFEDNIGPLCCEPATGNKIWNHIGRDLGQQDQLLVQNSGETQVYNTTITLDPAWNVEELSFGGFVSRWTGRVNQAGMAKEAHRVAVDHTNGTAAHSTGMHEYDAVATYLGATTGDVTVTLDKSGLPAGWDAEIVVGASTFPTSTTFSSMSENDTQAYSVRVLSNGAPALGTLAVTTEPSAGGRGTTVDLHTFHDTPSILFVDDDHSAAFETEFTNAITGAGYFHVSTDVDISGNPGPSEMMGYDVVVWTTGADQSGTIGPAFQNGIETYLDAGGSLFLSSQGYLNQIGTGQDFTTDYLRVSAFSQDAQAPTATGVALDVIGDGLNLTLSPPFVDFADAITANTGGVIWLNGANGDVGVRYDSGTFRTVFMSAAFEGVDVANEALLMGRIINWLSPPSGTTDVTPMPAAAATRLSLAQNAPNPFHGATAIQFAVPQSGPVSLSVYDVSGRKVAGLVDAVLESGTYSADWDGRDSSGLRVAGGVYFYRLQASGETLTKEMVRLR